MVKKMSYIDLVKNKIRNFVSGNKKSIPIQ